MVEPNESGKSTLCEAIVAALYGFPRSKGGALRPRDQRRPRGGAPLRLGLDVEADGTRWAVDRDLDEGTLRVVDRDRGEDRTRDFLRPGGRDVFGEQVTGLTEALFRTTAYVGQNVLDGDELDSTLTVELARIADSGGGEATVVRALRALEAVRARMPLSSTGPAVSVETEVVRAGRRVEERRAETLRLARAREAGREAAARLAAATARRDEAARAAALAEAAVPETERRLLAEHLAEEGRTAEARAALLSEAARLERDAELFTPQALAEIDALRHERGNRPEALARERKEIEADAKALEEDWKATARRIGAAATLDLAERARVRGLLASAIENAAEEATAAAAVAAQWEELRREGLAEDLQRLATLPPEERELVAGAEEERQALEIEGIRLDKLAAEALAQASIASAERRVRVRRSRGLVVLGAVLAPVAVVLLLARTLLPLPVAVATAVFSVSVALFGAVAWLRANGHRVEDEERSREAEARAREEAVRTRKKLSDLRLRLDQAARSAGFRDPVSLVKAQRKARLAEEKRRTLVEREVRLEAVRERTAALERELAGHRDPLGLSGAVPTPDEARAVLAQLADADRAEQGRTARAEALRLRGEILNRQTAELNEVELRLWSVLARLEIPSGLGLSDALLMAEAGRARAARRREILEVELPALEARMGADVVALAGRIAELRDEVAARVASLGVRQEDLAVASTPEAARRAAEEARAREKAAEEERLAAEREVAARSREGGQTAREAEEALLEAEGVLERALLFRDALDLAREALAAAASSAYGDFRRGLAEASRRMMTACGLPYEGLEFGEDLSVTLVARGGRVLTRAELAAAVSTGTREQVHLLARLAALRHLGTGSRGVPLLLDDALAGADDVRFSSVMRFLVEDVRKERPVLAVSCHGWRHDRWLAELPPELRDRVRRVALGRSRGSSEGDRQAPDDSVGEPEGGSAALGRAAD